MSFRIHVEPEKRQTEADRQRCTDREIGGLVGESNDARQAEEDAAAQHSGAADGEACHDLVRPWAAAPFTSVSSLKSASSTKRSEVPWLTARTVPSEVKNVSPGSILSSSKAAS